jgi:hypothetical protein
MSAPVFNRDDNFLRKVVFVATRLYRLQRFSETRKWFLDSLKFFRANRSDGRKNGILLTQMVRDYPFVVTLAAASKAIADARGLEVEFYDVNINWTWKARVLDIIEQMAARSLIRLHLAFGQRVAFRCSDSYRGQHLIQRKLKEVLDRLDMNDPATLLSITFDEVPVGDLIYDTYLRSFHQPTIEAIDEKVIQVIEVGLNVFYTVQEYLDAHNVKALVSSYTSYIQHGIPARVCLFRNIDVFTNASDSYVLQQQTRDFPYHLVNHTQFSPDRVLTGDQRQSAKRRIEARLSGVIDPAISYMRRSAFFVSPTSPELRELFARNRRNVVLYTHDFYDSPHINRQLQFPDLYQFLRRTLDSLTDAESTSVFIKVHPNGVEGVREKTIELVNSYNTSHFHIVDESVSNQNIIELRPTLVGTARGTVGIEMAYSGIPVVALFDNLYANFTFVHTCLDTATYFGVLRGEIEPRVDLDREQIYRFYHQAYMERALLEPNNILERLRSFKGDTYSDDYLDYLRSTDFLSSRAKLVEYYARALDT